MSRSVSNESSSSCYQGADKNAAMRGDVGVRYVATEGTKGMRRKHLSCEHCRSNRNTQQASLIESELRARGCRSFHSGSRHATSDCRFIERLINAGRCIHPCLDNRTFVLLVRAQQGRLYLHSALPSGWPRIPARFHCLGGNLFCFHCSGRALLKSIGGTQVGTGGGISHFAREAQKKCSIYTIHYITSIFCPRRLPLLY